MSDKLKELMKKMDHLDDLIEEQNVAYNEYLREVEVNKTNFMTEALYEMQLQITYDIRNKKEGCELEAIDDRIDDIFESKCKNLQSYVKYIKLKRDIALIKQMKSMQPVQG